MRTKVSFFITVLALFILSLAGCGGGDGGSSAVTGVSTGTITGTGSIFVNGVEYNTTGATVTMDDVASTASALKMGMVVTVKGTFDDDTHARASTITFNDNAHGPIATFDNTTNSMTVLGQNVKYDPVKTVFDNFSGAGTMGVRPGEMVEVSGYTDTTGTINATRIERKLPDWTPPTMVELKGTITAVGSNSPVTPPPVAPSAKVAVAATPTTATTFSIGALTVDISGLNLTTDMVRVGAFVKVEGTIPSLTSTTLRATSVRSFTEGSRASEGERMEVEGLVSGLSGTFFIVNGTTVNAGNLSLAGVVNGVKVEVKGNFVNGVLMATRISVEGAAPPPTTVPAAPTVMTAVGGMNQVTISWNAVSGATSYNLYYSTTAGVTTVNGTKIANVTSPYVQTGLLTNTTYYYVLTAVNAVGESPPSAQFQATTTSAPTVPPAPIGVAAVGGTGQVTITWAAVTGATSYNIYYATTTGVTPATGTQILNATSPYVQTGLANATTYYYVVTAVNAAGESAPSVQVSATTATIPTVPAAPTGLAATGGVNSVSISWNAVTGATSYNLYYATTTGVTPATGTLIAGVTSPYLQKFLAANTTYFYVVTAVNGSGASLPSAQASAITSATDGVTLYANNCAGCHGPLATSSKKGRTAAQIQAAINGNVGGMGFLSTLTATQVQAIATVLGF